MNINQIDIVNALYIFKGVCSNSEKCDYCPLYKDNTCMILRYGPDQWNINEVGEIWRAFK